jgi:hypothetical protein
MPNYIRYKRVEHFKSESKNTQLLSELLIIQGKTLVVPCESRRLIHLTRKSNYSQIPVYFAHFTQDQTSESVLAFENTAFNLNLNLFSVPSTRT